MRVALVSRAYFYDFPGVYHELFTRERKKKQKFLGKHNALIKSNWMT